MSPLLITLPGLPVPHGFSTRNGGISTGVHHSLNLGWNVGDVAERVRNNFERLAALGRFDVGRLHTLSQVHGVEIRQATGTPRESCQPTEEGDGLWTAETNVVVGVKTADCVPLLLVAPDVRIVAAVHSGWRGTLAGVVERALEALRQQGADARQLVAGIGPSIRRCCYEVSGDLAVRFRARFGGEVVDGDADHPRLDLVRAVERMLRDGGIPSAQIHTVDACTACDPASFFSHRRDAAAHGGQKGLHLSFAVCAFA